MPGMQLHRIIQRREVPADLESAMPQQMHAVLRRVYASRHVAPTELDVSLSAMIPVGALEGVDAAARRLAAARDSGEAILVLGDFDTDGATATALMVACLRKFGFPSVSYLVPDRFHLGYGLSTEIAELAAQRQPAVIVTVDNGITSCEGVARARELGADVIVTDHHLPGPELPSAQVIINPNLPGSDFPSKCLAGVGVAFYAMAALGELLARRAVISERDARRSCADCLDLVALGTVADLVPLDRNNRVLVSEGLRRIRAGRLRPGIRGLFDVAGRGPDNATASDLAYGLAPRLNAAGRLTDMSLGIDCLLAGNYAQARQLASRLDQLNVRRRELQLNMENQAQQHLDALDQWAAGLESGGYCLFDESWHEGIVGLVAARMRERVQGPVVAFARGGDGRLKGSARSVPGINVRDVIAAVAAREPGLIEKFGGHAMAAGLTLEADKLDSFRRAFEREVARFPEQIGQTEVLWTDGALSPQELDIELAETLHQAGPWGQGFPEPLFDNRFDVVEQRVVGRNHLKLKLRPEAGGQPVEGIAFNQSELPLAELGAPPTFVYRLDINTYRNRRTHQLVVEHIQCD